MMTATTSVLTIRCDQVAPAGWDQYLAGWGYDGFHLHSEWANIFRIAFRHQPWFLWAEQEGRIVGVLPLMHIHGPLFGSFLASQPYLNTGGVLANHSAVATKLVDRAVRLAEHLDVKHLELRQEQRIEHPALNSTNTEKVHMRMTLPSSVDALWNGLKSKLRSQVRKPLSDESMTVEFGRMEQLDSFYDIFCCNMRDLGTPPFSRELFRQMLVGFGERAEICTVLKDGKPVASGFLLHGPEVTLIPSASSLREYNHTACNMLMYWHCLKRSVELGQKAFDFGRSSHDSGTYKFKQQWGAEEYPAVWQYCLRRGAVGDVRPSSGKYDRMIAIWQKLPVWVTRLIGPEIVRGIP
ncbi:MAG: FemAB family PEP-CTERM system-associated protein [Planctomycetaceae bacterium]|nr:FemAB family PEP-CTERM system-associated protein [Planctomycetaceae bacterium]